MSEKQKLTLSVNKEVVDKAKEMGINISEITENVLRGFAFTPTELDDKEVYKQYTELFATMIPTLKKYDFDIEIASDPLFDERTGEHIHSFSISLLSNSLFWETTEEVSFSDISMISVSAFYPPMLILSKFLRALTNSVEKRKEHLRELEMAKQIVRAISGAILDRNEGSQASNHGHDRLDG